MYSASTWDAYDKMNDKYNVAGYKKDTDYDTLPSGQAVRVLVKGKDVPGIQSQAYNMAKMVDKKAMARQRLQNKLHSKIKSQLEANLK